MSIDSAIPNDKISMDFNGEITTSSATFCPLDGVFHASDGSTYPVVKPAIFSTDGPTYDSTTGTY